jgi:hypothetical protein
MAASVQTGLTFVNYAEPQSQFKFSRNYFYSLTLRRAAIEELPTFLPAGAVVHHVFTRDVSDARAKLLNPTDVVFALNDLSDFSSYLLTQAFNAGYRSVIFQYLDQNGKMRTQTIHFCRVSTFRGRFFISGTKRN